MTLEDAIDHAAGALNFGWQIEFTIEPGYAGLSLLNPDGFVHEGWEPNHEDTFVNQIIEACRVSHGLDPEP